MPFLLPGAFCHLSQRLNCWAYEPGKRFPISPFARNSWDASMPRRWVSRNAWRRNWVFHNFASGSVFLQQKHQKVVVSNMLYLYPYLRNWFNLTNMFFFRVVCNHELFMMSWLVYSWWRHAYWGSESTCFMMNDWWSHLLGGLFFVWWNMEVKCLTRRTTVHALNMSN